MKINNHYIKHIVKDISVSLLLYLLPIIGMFMYFYFTGKHPWETKHEFAFAFLMPFFQQFFSWGITAIVVLVGIVELLLGLYERRWKSNDRTLDIAGLFLPRIVGPVFAFFSAEFIPWILPTSRNIFSWVPFWWGFFMILISYDLTHYWVHRIHHQVPFLWKFHRSHHSAPYMGIWVDGRNNLFYHIFFSPVYIMIILSYLGLGESVFLFAALKAFVAISAHSTIHWDKPFYEKRWLHPVAWVLERTISTPATHHAHHAESNDDGIGHYNGNFGNTLFIWDIIFGTALITRKYPARYGVKNYQHEEWYAQLLWPLLKSRKKGSELSASSSMTGDESAECMQTSTELPG